MAAASSMMLGLTSCSDFLEEENKVGETAGLAYKTPAGLEGLVANCYTFARGWYGKEAGLGLSEMGTDLFYYGYDNKQKSLCSYNFNAAALETMWQITLVLITIGNFSIVLQMSATMPSSM